MNKYFMYHTHTHFTNPIMTDSITKPEQYVEKAVEYGMTALAFTEHGNLYKWKYKKDLINKAGLKYVHGIEVYATESLDEKIRDNYHIVLLARNYEGVKEINRLTSKMYNKEDLHFYYRPRLSLEEIYNTSDNVIITTACLGGVMFKGNDKVQKEFLQFMVNNKDRCFFEIQHHMDRDQINYNKKLYQLSLATGVRLVAGTDTHSLNERHQKARAIMQKSKNIYFDNEEDWDLVMRSYDELVDAYKRQNSLPMDVVLQAIDNTVVIEDMIEDFEFDTSLKYPKLHEDPEKVFKRRIAEGLIYRKANIHDPIIQERIQREYRAFKKTGTIDYMLLEDDVKTWCRQKGIPYGYGRGSVSGSYIAYLMQITEMDSIKHNLVFERFINENRVTMADIDSDYPSSQRDMVKQYLHDRDDVYCADIITFNTLQVKGVIRAVCRAVEVDDDTTDKIAKEYPSLLDNYNKLKKQLDEIYDEKKEKKLRDIAQEMRDMENEYNSVFEFLDEFIGVIDSVGSHPAGVIVSPIPLDDVIGMTNTKTNPNPVSVMDMKEVESLNFVKLDLLVLDTMEVIHRACQFADIPMITPDSLDTTDMNVWRSISDSAVGVFQWESSTAFDYYKKLFSPETLEEIMKENPDTNLIDIFSMGNGAIRPAGNSYRNGLSKGIFNENGHKALDDFLSSTLGYLIYQEQIMTFLHKFCGFTLAESDSVRRGLAKKVGTEQFMPQIKDGFIETMTTQYNTSKEDAEEIIIHFLDVIMDASGYGFSLNHSQAYSFIGFACAYLRYYYPLEFLTSALIVAENKKDKTASISNYMREFTDIGMKPIKFRYSSGDYSLSKEENKIYKGMTSIKYLSDKIADELLELKPKRYDTFVDLLVDATENTSCDKRQLEILIKLNFFEEFGSMQNLLEILGQFKDGKGVKYDKKYVEKTKEKRIELLKEFESSLAPVEISLLDVMLNELEYMGYIATIDNTFDRDVAIVSNIEVTQWGTRFVELYRPYNGELELVKVWRNTFESKPIVEGDLIQTITINHKPKKYDPDVLEDILMVYAKVEI